MQNLRSETLLGRISAHTDTCGTPRGTSRRAFSPSLTTPEDDPNSGMQESLGGSSGSSSPARPQPCPPHLAPPSPSRPPPLGRPNGGATAADTKKWKSRGAALEVGCEHDTRSRDRLAELESHIRQQSEESVELKNVILMKDEIIRSLGASLGEAQEETNRARELRDVVKAKDDIIRGLGLRLADIASTDVKPPVALNALDVSEHIATGTVDVAKKIEQRFTVAPVGHGDESNFVNTNEVGRQLAHFMGQRQSKVLFTSTDDGDHYLYGRLLVQCAVDEGVQSGISVSPLKNLVLDLNYDCPPLALESFLEQFEDTEHAYFESLWAPPGTRCPGSTEVKTECHSMSQRRMDTE